MELFIEKIICSFKNWIFYWRDKDLSMEGSMFSMKLIDLFHKIIRFLLQTYMFHWIMYCFIGKTDFALKKSILSLKNLFFTENRLFQWTHRFFYGQIEVSKNKYVVSLRRSFFFDGNWTYQKIKARSCLYFES